MTTPRKDPSKKSANKTKHQLAMADPKVLELASNLRRDWATMDRSERDKELRELAAYGCSARGLAKVLGQSATSILRQAAPAERPKTDRDMREAHASAQAAAELRASAQRDECQRQRISEDQKTGAHSDELAAIISEFCRAGEVLLKTPILNEEVPRFLSIVEKYLSQFEAAGRPLVGISRDWDLKQFIMLACPDEIEGEQRMEHYGKWLAIVVRAKAPERPIWERALGKALNRARELALQLNRAGVLPPQRLKVDPYRAWVDRVVKATDPNVRPHRDPDATDMGKQGRPTTPPEKRP